MDQEKIIEKLNKIINRKPLILKVKGFNVTDIIEDKKLHIKGYRNAQNGHIQENVRIDNRTEHYEGEEMLTAAQKTIADSLKGADEFFKRFASFLKMQIENPNIDVREYFTEEELDKFNRITNNQTEDFFPTDLSFFLMDVFWVQVFAEDGYYNGGTFIVTLDEARKGNIDYLVRTIDSPIFYPKKVYDHPYKTAKLYDIARSSSITRRSSIIPHIGDIAPIISFVKKNIRFDKIPTKKEYTEALGDSFYRLYLSEIIDNNEKTIAAAISLIESNRQENKDLMSASTPRRH